MPMVLLGIFECLFFHEDFRKAVYFCFMLWLINKLISLFWTVTNLMCSNVFSVSIKSSMSGL